MKTPKLLYNARIVNEGYTFTGYVCINEEGIIASVNEGICPEKLIQEYGVNVRNLNGNLLLPGVIDSHVHFREPGMTHKADIYSESRAAVAGGVTSFMEMPNTNPPTVSVEALEEKFKIAAKNSLANYSFYIGATNSNIDVLKQIDYTRVPGVKLFMGSSTGGMLVDGNNTLDAVFSLPVLIAAHCEDETIIRNNVAEAKTKYPDGGVPISMHPEIRSAEACIKSTIKAIDYAKRHNARLHIMHITTADELEIIKESPENITAEVCVAHLLFDSSDYDKLGTKIKCNPAVKCEQHRAALREAVKDDIISTISTDHAPHTIKEKQGDALTAPSGMPMIQYSLPAVLNLTLAGNFTIEKVVEKMCHAQAKIFDIRMRGYIRPGYYADLVEVNPDEITHVSDNSVLSKCKWTPLSGVDLHSKVKTTWVNGVEVYNDTDGIIEPSVNPAMPLHFH